MIIINWLLANPITAIWLLAGVAIVIMLVMDAVVE